MKPSSPEQPPINVAVACDIRLREVAHANPSMVIDIDPIAIQDYLDAFGKPYVRVDEELLFVACESGSMDNYKVDGDKVSYRSGDFHIDRFDAKTGEPLINKRPVVRIALTSPLGILGKNQNPLRQQQFYQRDSIHELSHALDYYTKVLPFSNRITTFEEFRVVAGYKIKRFGVQAFETNANLIKKSVIGYTSLVAAQITIDQLNIDRIDALGVGVSIGGLYFVFGLLNNTTSVMMKFENSPHERYLATHHEIRARKAEEASHLHKPIISITQIE